MDFMLKFSATSQMVKETWVLPIELLISWATQSIWDSWERLMDG
jgi:hypothetical protein